MVSRPALRGRALVLDAWPLLLAAVLVLPLLTTGGHPLARDLIFVPRQPWTDASLGLGDASPRAVPLDAIVSLLTLVVDGGVLAKIVLPLVLATAGWGAHRLLPDAGTTARLVLAGFAVWNPYVVERLALGQWALLAGYAALPWLALATLRFRDSGGLRDLAGVTLWLGVASLTPTGGLLGLATALVLGATRSRRILALLAVGLVLQLPWLLPGLLGAAGLTSDPTGVASFAARGEGPGGVVLSVLGLGGIWDSLSVPGSRGSAWGLVATLVLLVMGALGVAGLRRCWGTSTLVRVALLAAAGLVLALISTTGPGADVVRWAVAEVPGAGLLRDAQKYVGPWALLAACALAAGVDAVVRRVRTAGVEVAVPLALAVVVLPLLLLPDATRVTWPTVEPVIYPAEVKEIVTVVAADPADVVTLPWRSYRRFDWGSPLIASDPAPRLLDADVLVSDELAVGDRTVTGENVRAAQVDAALQAGPPAQVLPDLGVGWVLIWRDDPDAEALDLTGLDPVVIGDDVALYRVPGRLVPASTVGSATRRTVWLADLLAALLIGLAVVGVAARPATRRLVSRKPVSDRSR